MPHALRRELRAGIALLAAACALLPAGAGRAATRGARRAATAPAPAARPDRALYYEAKAARDALAAAKGGKSRRSDWDRAVLRYRSLVSKYPQSPYCDDALQALGEMYREMARRFAAPRLKDEATAALRAIVEEYPSSSLGEPALFGVLEIAREGGDRRRVAEAARAYLDAYPDGPHARVAKGELKRSAPEKAAALPSPPPPGLSRVFNLRFWSGADSTRVVVDVEKPVAFKHDRIRNPDRLWVDLAGTRLHPNLKDRAFPVGDGLLEQVRVGQNKDDVVRVVLDFKEVRDYGVYYLEDPARLVIDVRGSLRPAVASAEAPGPGAPDPSPAPPATLLAMATPPPRPVATPAAASPTPGPSPRETPQPEARSSLPARRVDRIIPPEPSPDPVRTPAPLSIEGPAQRPTPAPARAAEASGPAAPPQANRAGSYSVYRQLGLGVGTIVIDAGHGGHDPGAIGPRGLMEKELVLDVARRLERMVSAELGAQVIMTRATDVFIPLEERTGIANSRGADLFLSIHANSSRSRSARGIETYFLNFAANPHAEEVAARENAISTATLKDLQSLVKAITLNGKIDESRDFAASVQESLVDGLQGRYKGAVNRGVHTAPFYVLIGANMPSILAEIAFVSHPEEERLLKSPEYREAIARGLFSGVRAYLSDLNPSHSRKLTSRTTGSTVAGKGRRR
jgi:N-acetylmuramoyl-L-alanine amidase